MPSFDPVVLRQEFPALGLQQDGRPVAYFDGPGGTQVPSRVIDAVADYFRTSNANAGGAFATSRRSDGLTAEAHAAVADFLGARSPEEIKFGYNMTTLTFHVSRSIAGTLSPRDEILVTTLDHEANVAPWQAVARERGLTVRSVDVHPEDYTLDLGDLEAKLTRRTRVVAVGHASNAVGTVNPVRRISELAHDAGALVYVDAVHSVPHLPVDVAELGCDLLVCSVYKWFGPHLGALYGRGELLEQLPAYKVRPAHDGFETGTASFEAISGTLAATEYLRDIGRRLGHTSRDGAGAGDLARRSELRAAMEAIQGYEQGLSARLLAGLEAIRGVRVWGITDPGRLAERTPTVSVTIDGVSPRAAAGELGRAGIFTWDGHFYAQALIERLGLAETGGALRLGAVHYNTAEEVDRLLAQVERIASGAAQPPVTSTSVSVATPSTA